MVILGIAYGVDSFYGASILVDGEIVASQVESGCCLTLPKNLIESVLARSGKDISNVDYVAFLGKPLSYFEQLIKLHMESFPRKHFKFFGDFRDFFSNKIRVKSALKKELGFCRDLCYVEPTDAIAYQMIDKGKMAAVVLSDVLSVRAGGLYQKKDDSLWLVKEFSIKDFPES
ncbi:MAG: hypothetical protein ABIH71_05230 [Candidatus Omnitrophota bacterium]|nr:hypothetical protein [Candidatus Omnitrophota bacterium]